MAWSVLQSTSSAATSAALTKAVTYGSNVSAGTKLICYVSASTATGQTISVKDGASNSFTQVAFVQNTTTGVCGGIWAIDTPAGDVGTTPTITATLSTQAADMAILVQEVSGLAVGNTLAAMVDGTAATNTFAAAASDAQPAYSSNGLNEFLVALCVDNGGPQTVTQPGGYTLDAHAITNNSLADVAPAYKNSVDGAETGTWTFGGTTTPTALLVVAFLLPPTGATRPHIGGQQWRKQQRHRQLPLLAPQQNPYPIRVLQASTAAVTLPVSTGAGDAIIVDCNVGSNATACSDTQGNTYQFIQNDTTDQDFVFVATYNGTPGTPTLPLVAGTDTITVTGAGTSGTFAIIGVRGAAPYPVDQNPPLATATSASASGPTTTGQSAANEVVIACYNGGSISQIATSWGAGFLQVIAGHGTASCISIGANFPNSNAPITPSATLAVSAHWVGFTFSLFLNPYVPLPQVSTRQGYSPQRVFGVITRRPRGAPLVVQAVAAATPVYRVTRQRVQQMPSRGARAPTPAPPLKALPPARPAAQLRQLPAPHRPAQQRTTLQVSGPLPVKPQTGSRARWNEIRHRPTAKMEPPLQVSGPLPAITRVGLTARWNSLRWRPKYPWQPPLQVSGPAPQIRQAGTHARLLAFRKTTMFPLPLRPVPPWTITPRLRTLAYRWKRQAQLNLVPPAPPATSLQPTALPRKAIWFHIRQKRTQEFAPFVFVPPVLPTALPRKAPRVDVRLKRTQQQAPPMKLLQPGLPPKARWNDLRRRRQPPLLPPLQVSGPSLPFAGLPRKVQWFELRRKRQAQLNLVPPVPPTFLVPNPQVPRKALWFHLRPKRTAQLAPLVVIPKIPPTGLPHKAIWMDWRPKRTQQFAPPVRLPFAGLARKVVNWDLRRKRSQQFAPIAVIAKLPPTGPRRRTWLFDTWPRPRRTIQSPLLGGLAPPPTFNKATSVSSVTDPRDGRSGVTDPRDGHPGVSNQATGMSDLYLGTYDGNYTGTVSAIGAPSARNVNASISTVSDPREAKAGVS